MTIALTLLLALLSFFDPVGAKMVKPWAIHEAGHIVHPSGPVFAVAKLSSNTILIDLPLVSDYFTRNYDANEGDIQRAGACILVHEGAHLKYRDTREIIPLLHEYVCLDRIAAPQYMKDIVYRQISELP